MSIIFEVENDLSNLPDIVIRYDKDLQYVEERIIIEGKSLERVNLEHASWQSYYDQKRIELYSLMKYAEDYVESVKGEFWVNYTERFSVALNTKDKEMYINKEPSYIHAKRLYHIVVEQYKKYESVVDAFRSRGFALRNITNVRVAALEDVVL